MRVLIVNSCSGCLSTGRIAAQIAKDYIDQGNEAIVAYARDYKDAGIPTHKIGTKIDVISHALKARLFDSAGFESKNATKDFIKWAEDYNPDVLWLHNLHSYYIDCEQLFKWIKSRPNMQVKWTLHDCWSFTGHCSNFTSAKCSKWTSHCSNCPQTREYPSSLIDRSSKNFDKKRETFLGVTNMTLITPSQWLADLVQKSYLKDYTVNVIYNKIDKTVFRPTPSNLRKIMKLENKIMILGVASSWGARKGLQDFVELSKMLDSRYAIVLVGLDAIEIESVKKERPIYEYSFTESKYVYGERDIEKYIPIEDEIASLRTKIAKGVAIEPNVDQLYIAITGVPFNSSSRNGSFAEFVCIQKTNNITQLAELYSAADVFVNPTHADNYPTVNLEAQACGTEIITYDIGGCSETIHNI